MHNIRTIMAASATAALLASAGAALAQTPARPAGAAAAAQVPVGPVIPGVCVFSNEGAVASSAVGKYVDSRLKQIQQQVQAEVQGEAQALKTDEQAYVSQRASLTSDVQQQRELAFNQREQSLQRKAEIRGREFEATRQKAVARIVNEYNPLLNQSFHARNCGLLLDGTAVLGVNPAMDLTPDVVRQLDAKITQFPFDREHLDQPTPGATPPAAAARPGQR